MAETINMTITYTLSLTITRNTLGCDPSFTDAEHIEWMAGPVAKRELEREVLQALKKLDGDCDCEVMETETKEES